MLVLVAAVVLSDPAVIAKGSTIFANSCGIGYCHGKAGAANRGPRLAGRKFDKDFLFKVISEGAGKGAMPGFANQYPPDDLWAVVAYILSLSEGLAAPSPTASAGLGDLPPAARTSEGSGARPSPASPEASSAVPEKDPFAAGRAVFQERCAGCHAWRGKGGEVGPDLTAQAGREPSDILRDIVDPGSRLSIQPIAVVLKSGERVAGVKKQETAELVRIYDASSLPPVLRTIYKDQVQSIVPEATSPMPSDFGRMLTEEQLRALIEFLRAGR